MPQDERQEICWVTDASQKTFRMNKTLIQEYEVAAQYETLWATEEDKNRRGFLCEVVRETE